MSFVPHNRRRHSQRGYILLSLMLIVALMAIAAAAIAPTFAFQVQRDREEELIHRGVQYSRAVRHYYKKFGRYPTRLEDLENTNNLRFLRRRYKDPITNQDFKLLHFGEVQMAMGGGITGGSNPGTPIGNGPAGTTASTGGGFSLNSTSASGNSFGGGLSNQGSANSGLANNGLANSGQGGQSSQDAGSGNANANSSSGNPPGAAPNSQPGSGGPSGQTFGGGPIVGVVSTSKAASVRVFNNKDHYNQWQFIYDPSTDRGGLLNTPAQPALQNAVAALPGTTGATGAPGGFGAQTPGMTPGTSPFGQQMTGSMNSQPQPNQPQQNQPQPLQPAQP